ncbi:hypothetical protein D5S18_17390 [Nocardia panacis]|uniref:Uncharacterized protein n=1 Tax=Nocardia panacis TaxID=2340916 RepID=A0A3A4KJQ4_9NOCA|nr:hypothetical protein [Nocardia panacis]RJO75142.1 hypothetical protein D5S18_17390 [Nocardia panacis]
MHIRAVRLSDRKPAQGVIGISRTAIALLAVLLLGALMLNCAAHGHRGHEHPAVQFTASSVGEITSPVIDHDGESCGWAAHCLVKSLPPTATEPLPLQQMIWATTLLAVLQAIAVLARGMRGPPMRRVVAGREILTHFCIARR